MKNILLIIITVFSGAIMASQKVEPLPEQLQKEVSIDLNERLFYPIIKPGDWPGLKNGAVYTSLIGAKEKPELVIGFGYDTPDNFIFLMHHNSQEINLNEAVEQAFTNIESIDVTFIPLEILDNKALIASAQSFSSEAILSTKQMLKAHKLLNAKQLLVSIPRRTGLMVISKDAPKEILNKFLYLHNHAWNDESDGNAPIANMLFVIEAGKISGTIPLIYGE